jgi:hypothetical protein
MAENGLKYAKVIKAMLEGSRSDAEISASTGISTRQIGRYKIQEPFKKLLRQATAQVVEVATIKLATSAPGAVDVLHDIAHDPIMPPASRVAAARSIAAMAIENEKLETVSERVDELEKRVELERRVNSIDQGWRKRDEA